jgi:hypothetical protein
MAKKPKIQTRKPPAPRAGSSAAMAQFITGGTVGPVAALGPQGGRTTTYTRKRGGVEGRVDAKVTVCIPLELLRTAKVRAAAEGTSLSALAVEALEALLAKRA